MLVVTPRLMFTEVELIYSHGNQNSVKQKTIHREDLYFTLQSYYVSIQF